MLENTDRMNRTGRKGRTDGSAAMTPARKSSGSKSCDTGYKLLFSHPELVRDLLEGFVHEKWVREIDFTTLEMVPASYVSDDLRERHDDRVWKVRLRNSWVYIYLLLEFQSSDDYFMPVRIQAYSSLCYQDIIRREKLKRGDLLPPLMPIVVYNGIRSWKSPLSVRELVMPPPEGMEKYIPDMRYYIIDESRIEDSELESAGDNLMGLLIRIEKCRSPEEIRSVIGRLKNLLDSDEYLVLRRTFSIWLCRMIGNRFAGKQIKELNELQEVDAMLAERIDEWVEQWKNEGMQQGIQKGKLAGKLEGRLEGKQERAREIILRMHRLGSDPDFIASVVDMPVESVKEIIASDS